MLIEDGRRIGLIDKEPVDVRSVGVLVHTRTLSPAGDPSFLLVESVGNEGVRGWSIAAGRPESFEKHPLQTAVREIKEETGLSIRPINLRHFAVIDKIEDSSQVRMIYRCSRTPEELFSLGNFVFKDRIWVTEGKRISDEVSRMAIVPRDIMFWRGHSILDHYSRWDIMHWIKARLEGLKVI